MVYTKNKFKSPIESDFPSVDIEQDQSLTIQEILYNVSHGLPTGLVPGYVEFDDDDSENPPNFVDDEFEALDSIYASDGSNVDNDGEEASDPQGTHSQEPVVASDNKSVATEERETTGE